MKENLALRVTTMLSVLFATAHITDDVLYGFEKGDTRILFALPIMAIWLWGALVPSERKWGYVIIILGSLLGLAIPIVHMKGSGIGTVITESSGGFFFIWTMIALGITSTLSIILSISGLVKKRANPA